MNHPQLIEDVKPRHEAKKFVSGFTLSMRQLFRHLQITSKHNQTKLGDNINRSLASIALEREGTV